MTTRTLGILIFALSTITLAVSGYAMAQRLADREVQIVYFTQPVPAALFEFRGGTTEVIIAEGRAELPAEGLDLSPVESLEHDRRIIIRYRGVDLSFPIVGRFDDRLEGSLRYDDWFRILPMVTGASTSIEAKEITQRNENRMVVAARYPAADFDEGSWGLVRRSEWLYRIAELIPPGMQVNEEHIAESRGQILRNEQGVPVMVLYEKVYEELDALHTPGKYTPKRHPEWIPTPERRDRDLWLHYTMQQVTPSQFFRAKDRTMDAAFSSMGWTWPAAGVSILGILVGAGMWASSRVKPTTLKGAP